MFVKCVCSTQTLQSCAKGKEGRCISVKTSSFSANNHEHILLFHNAVSFVAMVLFSIEIKYKFKRIQAINDQYLFRAFTSFTQPGHQQNLHSFHFFFTSQPFLSCSS